MEATLIISILIVAIQAGTSLVYATVGEIFAERSGILNLGVEGMMIMGAVIALGPLAWGDEIGPARVVAGTVRKIKLSAPPCVTRPRDRQRCCQPRSSCRHRMLPSGSRNQAARSEPSTQTCSTVLKPGRS